MAQVQYNEGIPDVAPRTSVPDDYQNIRATPEMFGAQIGRGLEEAGKGASTAAHFFGEVAANDSYNQLQDFGDKLYHGDPTKVVGMGPDGKPQYDTGYKGLKGRASLDARQGVEQALDEKVKSLREGLTTPDQQFLFDQYSRRYRAVLSSQIGDRADQEANSYYADVENQKGANARTHIANNAGNFTLAMNGIKELMDATGMALHRQGAQPGDDVWTARMGAAKAEGTRIWIQSIAADKPALAQQMLREPKNREALGTEYPALADHVRGRAEQQNAVAAGDKALADARGEHPFNNPALPIWRDVSATANGFSPSGTAKMVKIESGGNPNAVNGSHVGLTQIGNAVWDQFGQGDRRDPVQNLLAAQRNAAANAQIIAPVLGRDPTDAELYLAHQQGGAGAAKLLANPNARAGSLVGDAHIRDNGGDPNAPAFMFTNMWIGRFNGSGGWALPAGLAAPGAIPARPSVRSSAYQNVLDMTARGELNANERQQALTYIHQTLAAQDIADNNTEKQEKQMVAAAADEWLEKINTGKMDVQAMGQLALDPRLKPDWKTREHLMDVARTHSGSDIAGASMQYGPGFWALYKRATLPPGDPGRIGDVTQVLGRAGEGGDLTLAGVQKLSQIMEQNRKSVSDAAVNTAKVGLINYAKNKLSFEADTGPIKIRDPKGEAIFNGTFIPKFEAAYDAWTKDGKDPWQFLSHENIDKMIGGMRSKSEMAMDKIRATGEASGEAHPDQPAPPAPQGIEQPRWDKLMAVRPIAPTGGPIDPRNWAEALANLRADPEKIAPYFKKLWPDFEPADLLKQMEGAVKPTPPEQTFRPAETRAPAPAAATPQAPLTPAQQARHEQTRKEQAAQIGFRDVVEGLVRHLPSTPPSEEGAFTQEQLDAATAAFNEWKSHEGERLREVARRRARAYPPAPGR